MKKLVLSLVAVSTMLAAGAANAAQTPFSGQLDFSGVITDTAPVWKWEIPAASQTAAKGWTTKKDSGVVTGANTVFTLDNADIPFIQGYTPDVIGEGSPGLLPTITVAGNHVLTNTPEALDISVTGDNKADAGTLKMTVTGGAAFGYSTADGFASAVYKTPGALGQVAYNMISKNAPAGAAPGDNDNAWVWAAEAISGKSGYKDLVSSYATNLGKFSLSFPTASIPDAWTATVPVTVTYS
ncbi:hypothetical protein C9J21_21910 [Photobacterium phosphoreum]|uniref:F4 family fimbrial subunit n=1 Tax=Photobacterium phosphoreum TaxID=659 RepID=UPI000D15F540|nr:hypothetical protein [Photobacterium phosphoreum]PSW24738.1 hypothetical protein C9J21_21910 [Photobacterium phosphoreum]